MHGKLLKEYGQIIDEEKAEGHKDHYDLDENDLSNALHQAKQRRIQDKVERM